MTLRDLINRLEEVLDDEEAEKKRRKRFRKGEYKKMRKLGVAGGLYRPPTAKQKAKGYMEPERYSGD